MAPGSYRYTLENSSSFLTGSPARYRPDLEWHERDRRARERDFKAAFDLARHAPHLSNAGTPPVDLELCTHPIAHAKCQNVLTLSRMGMRARRHERQAVPPRARHTLRTWERT